MGYDADDRNVAATNLVGTTSNTLDDNFRTQAKEKSSSSQQALLSASSNQNSSSKKSDYSHHEGHWEVYIGNKRRKVASQFANKYKSKSSLFSNCIIWINGRTRPPASELTALICENGGQVINTLEIIATHVVCDTLPITKLKQIRQLKKSSHMPVMRPIWVLDSIKYQKIMPINPNYQLKSTLNIQSNIRNIDYFHHQTPSTNKNIKNTMEKGGNNNINNNKEQTIVQHKQQQQREKQKAKQKQQQHIRKQFESKDNSNADQSPEHKNENENGNNENDGDEVDYTKIFGRQSTLTNPNFVFDFFKTSRLHFLGSWKVVFDEIYPQYCQIIPKYNSKKFSKLGDRYVMHIDMDCYFVSVALLDMPQYDINKHCCVVSHSRNDVNSKNNSKNDKRGSGDISSCNYVARKYGMKNGMWIGRARDIAKENNIQLIVLPYKFDKILQTSKIIYKIFFQFTNIIQSQSIDEAYLQFPKTKLNNNNSSYNNNRRYKNRNGNNNNNNNSETDIVNIANEIRQEIFKQTGCRASVGIGDSILVAKLATNYAKPDGVYLLEKEKENENENETASKGEPQPMARSQSNDMAINVNHAHVNGGNGNDASGLSFNSVIDNLHVSKLPGIGWKLNRKFRDDYSVHKIGDLKNNPKLNSKQKLQSIFGNKIGLNISNYINGIDNRELQCTKMKKSICVEIGWGIRFNTIKQVSKFFNDLSCELSNRMKSYQNVKGKHITLRIKFKHPDAPNEPSKHLGQGWCVTQSKSIKLNNFINDQESLFKTIWNIFTNKMANINQKPKILRSVGIIVTKLNNTDKQNNDISMNQDGSHNARLSQFFNKGGANSDKKNHDTNAAGKNKEKKKEKKEKAKKPIKVKSGKREIDSDESDKEEEDESDLDVRSLSKTHEIDSVGSKSKSHSKHLDSESDLEMESTVELDGLDKNNGKEKDGFNGNFDNINDNKNKNEHNDSLLSVSALPPLSAVDETMIADLPKHIQMELAQAYKIKYTKNASSKNVDSEIINKLQSRFDDSAVKPLIHPLNKQKFLVSNRDNNKHSNNNNRKGLKNQKNKSKWNKFGKIDKKQKLLQFNNNSNRGNNYFGNERVNKNQMQQEKELMKEKKRNDVLQANIKACEIKRQPLFANESFETIFPKLIKWFNMECEKSDTLEIQGNGDCHECGHTKILNVYFDDCLQFKRLQNIQYIIKYLKRVKIDDVGLCNGADNINLHCLSPQMCQNLIDNVQLKIKCEYDSIL